jgi:hypothetical protein
VLGVRLLLWLGAFAALFGPYYLWRFSYYGYPFPNTFYAKVGAGVRQYLRGVRYLQDYARLYGAFTLLLPLVLLGARRRPAWVDVLALQLVAYAAYVVYVGGDGLGFFRFIACVAPMLYLLVQEAVVQLDAWLGARLPALTALHRGLLLAAPLAIMLAWGARQGLTPLLRPERSRWTEPQSELQFPLESGAHHYVWFDTYFVDRLRVAAEWLEANTPADAVVAATPAGAVGYYLDRPVIDMLGLNDLHIAHSASNPDAAGSGRAGHEKGDGAYVLSRQPDYILLGNVAVLPQPLTHEDMGRKLVLKSEHEIWADPTFHQRYELVTVTLDEGGPFAYFSFYRLRPEYRGR